jgi:hypothetical protein
MLLLPPLSFLDAHMTGEVVTGRLSRLANTMLADLVRCYPESGPGSAEPDPHKQIPEPRTRGMRVDADSIGRFAPAPSSRPYRGRTTEGRSVMTTRPGTLR